MAEDKNLRNRVDDIDKLVSRNLKAKRLIMGLSQSDLADSIGVSVQQVQKYEKGVNRISSSKLYQLANLLDVPVSFFFEISYITEYEETKSQAGEEISEQEIVMMIKAFNQVEDSVVRRKVIELLKCLAENTHSPIHEKEVHYPTTHHRNH